jgi:hypothetical protein
VFNPDITQRVLDTNHNSLFVLLRGPTKEGSYALCIENLGNSKAVWKPTDIVSLKFPVGEIVLEPWETRWLVWNKDGVTESISS